MADGRCLSKITQGVTTEIMGEATTPAPVTGRNEGGIGTAVYGGLLADWVEPAKRMDALPPLAGGGGGGRHLAQRRFLPGRRHPAQLRQGDGHDPRHRGGAAGHGPGRGGGHGGRRLRPLLRPDLPARLLRRHRRDRRGLRGRRAVRRRLHHPPAVGRGGDLQRPRRGLRDRRPRRRAGGDLPPEGRGTGPLGQDARGHRPHRRGPRRRAGRGRRHVSLRRLGHRPDRGPAALDRGGGPALRAPGGPGRARENPERRRLPRRELGADGHRARRRGGDADRLPQAGEPGVRRPAALGDRRRARRGLVRHRLPPVAVGASAHRHHLLLHDRGQPAPAARSSRGSRSPPTPAASTRPGRGTWGRCIPAATAPILASSAATSATSGSCPWRGRSAR